MIKTNKHLEFFKVFLPEFNSQELVIPPTFIDILSKPLPNEALLLDEIERIWSVKIKTEDTEERFRVFFDKGWEIFAKDQSLEFGDFLVFSYDGDSRFYVTIFNNDGCRKDFGDVTTTRVSGEEEPVDDDFTKPDQDFGKRFNQNRRGAPISVKEEPGVLDDVSTSKAEPVHRENTRGKVNRTRDSSDDMSWSNLPEKKQKGFQEPVYKPKNPHFVRTMTDTSLTKIEIPTSFLGLNRIEMEEEVELYDENGKNWTLKMMKYNRGVKVVSREAWIGFCKTHKLMKKSKCLFEFIVGSEGRCNEIHVRVFSERLLTCSTRTGYQIVAM